MHRTRNKGLVRAKCGSGPPDAPNGHLDDETMDADPVAAQHACRQHLQRLKDSTSSQRSPPGRINKPPRTRVNWHDCTRAKSITVDISLGSSNCHPCIAAMVPEHHYLQTDFRPGGIVKIAAGESQRPAGVNLLRRRRRRRESV